jgi:hypothetical protein
VESPLDSAAKFWHSRRSSRSIKNSKRRTAFAQGGRPLEEIMRRLMFCLLAAASVLVGTAATRAAEPPDDPPARKSSGLLSLLGLRKQADKKEEAKREPRPIRIDPAALLLREKQDHARRMEVCIRLREIAIQNNDPALEAQADALEHRAFDLFRQRMSELATASRGSAADEQAISRRLSDTRSQDRLAGAGDRSRSNGQRAATREDN